MFGVCIKSDGKCGVTVFVDGVPCMRDVQVHKDSDMMRILQKYAVLQYKVLGMLK